MRPAARSLDHGRTFPILRNLAWNQLHRVSNWYKKIKELATAEKRVFCEGKHMNDPQQNYFLASLTNTSYEQPATLSLAAINVLILPIGTPIVLRSAVVKSIIASPSMEFLGNESRRLRSVFLSSHSSTWSLVQFRTGCVPTV